MTGLIRDFEANFEQELSVNQLEEFAVSGRLVEVEVTEERKALSLAVARSPTVAGRVVIDSGY